MNKKKKEDLKVSWLSKNSNKNSKEIFNDNFVRKIEFFAYYLIVFGSLGIIIYGIYIVVNSSTMK